MRLLFCVAAAASAIAVACSPSVEGPTEAWCSEVQPFVDRDGSTRGSIEIVEVTDENRAQVERESSEQRSRIAVLVSSSPPRIQDEIERMLLDDRATVEQRESAREDVTSYYSDHC